MRLMSRPRSGSTASLPGGRNFLPPEMRGVEHGCAQHRVKRTALIAIVSCLDRMKAPRYYVPEARSRALRELNLRPLTEYCCHSLSGRYERGRFLMTLLGPPATSVH
jgi:hypothetical protein